MATISAFCPIRPNPFFAGELVFTTPRTESVAGDYTRDGTLKPLKTLLETGARLRPETGEGQLRAYQDINISLGSLLANEHVWREPSPAIFIYEVVHNGHRQTGVWALTALADYRGGRIRIHELTIADSVRRLKNYRENTGLEGSPVLLTYRPDPFVREMIALAKASQPKMSLGNQHGLHKIWKVENEDDQSQLISAFSKIGPVYLADGHHRLESAVILASQQEADGRPVFDTISSLYMATDELRILPYDRLVLPPPVPKEDLLNRISEHFYVLESTGNQPVRPSGLHRIGMCLDRQWYHLLPRALPCSGDHLKSLLDAAILQEQLLGPVFGITDPKTDKRLVCAGGEHALEEISAILNANPAAIAFTLSPMTVEQLIEAADEGRVLPPKATWIVPKVPYGLLIHRHEIVAH